MLVVRGSNEVGTEFWKMKKLWRLLVVMIGPLCECTLMASFMLCIFYHYRGFPDSTSGKEPACQ